MTEKKEGGRREEAALTKTHKQIGRHVPNDGKSASSGYCVRCLSPSTSVSVFTYRVFHLKLHKILI